MSEPLIYHLFADAGVESEVLSTLGRVVRVGIDPERHYHSDVITADARDPPLQERAALAVCHPNCRPYSRATDNGGGDRAQEVEQIDEARAVAESIADYYIVENVPEAPLRDPVVLNGHMFGKPFRYARAFETNYHVEQPPRERALTTTEWGEKNGQTGEAWSGTKQMWAVAKGYRTDYGIEDLRKTAIPRVYLSHLLRPLVERGVFEGEA